MVDPMVEIKVGDMDDEKLIESVRKYEFIYNLQHPKYMDTIKKEIAWKGISEQLKQPAVACKQRWQKLRDAYRRALNKRKGRSGQAAKKIKKWRYEDEMSFVLPFFLERKTLDSVDFTSDDKDPDNDDERRETDIDISENPNTDNVVNDTADLDLDNIKTEFYEENENAIQYNNLQTKKAKAGTKIKTQTAQSASVALMAEFLEDQQKIEPQREHELDRFFQSISDTVKRFPPFLQAVAKNKIFSLVSEMELQQLAPPSNVPHLALPSSSSFQYAYSNAHIPSPQSTTSSITTPIFPDNWDENSDTR